MAKPLIVRTRNARLLHQAVREGFTQFLVEGSAPLRGAADALRLDGDVIRRNGKTVGRYVRIRGRADEQKVRALKGKTSLVIVEPTDWKVIPLENLIAALNGKTRLYAVARSAQEAKLFLETLEKGVDGVVVSPTSLKDLRAYKDLRAPDAPAARLVPATITRLEPLGSGERVCVDTANLFHPGEGLLVGSASHAFFLVAAECYETEYVAARPFRVNAGAVHAYVWNGEATQYLSEVRAGLTLRAVDPRGRTRSVLVGRAKIETRPLLLIEVEVEGRRATVLLQNAETIRLVSPRGKAKSVNRLRVGDQVLVHPETGARHFGMKVEETIREV